MAKRRNWEDDFEDEDLDSGDFENFDDELKDFDIDEEEDLFDFELKERWEERKREQETAIQSYEVNHPGMGRYGSKARRVISEYQEHIQEFEGDDIERTISRIPTEIGNRVLSRIEDYVTKDESDAIGRYEEDDTASGLERKVGGLLRLARTKDFHDEELFDAIVSQVESSEDERPYNALVNISSDIATSKDDSRLPEHLKAFLMSVSANNASNPKDLFSRLVNVPYMTDLTISTRGKVNKIPKHIGDILEDESTREEGIKMLTQWPASVHLSADRLTASLNDPQYKSFVRNWVGENASADRVEFFDGLYDQYGYEGLVRLGKPLLKTVLAKGKGNKKLQDKLRQEGIGKIYEQIPESNRSPPTWLFGLRQKIEGADPERVLSIIDEEIGQLGREDREKVLRSKYATLVRKVKKTTPVARGDYSTGDIITTLDERLLDAMQFEDTKKTRMLEAMGKNLKRVNKVYKDSGLPAGVVVGLYDSKHDHKQIVELGRSLEDNDKDNLRKSEEEGRLGTLFWLARNGLNVDDIGYVASLSVDEQLQSFEKVARATQNPRQYFSSLSLEQMVRLGEVDQEVMADVVGVVDPNSLGDYIELAKLTNGKINGALRTKRKNVDFSRFKGHEDVFNMLEGGWSQEDAKAIAGIILDSTDDQTATKYCEALKSLTPYARISPDRWGGRRDATLRYGPIATTLKGSNETELDVYGKIGEVYTKSSSWGSTRERVGFDKLQELVKKTAELVDITPGLRERVDSFVGHVKNYTSSQERMGDLEKLESIAKATVSATPEESQLLADIGSRHVGFTFTDQNLQKVRGIENLSDKLPSLKGMSDLVRSEDQLGTILDYAVHNTPEILTTAYQNLRQGFSNDDEFYGTLAISRDKDLSQKSESIDQGYRPTFLKFAASVGSPDRLKTLPESHFYLAAQAYEFAKQHEMGDVFFDGLNGSLQQGTVDQWSNAIIKHFRDESKGGGVYRKLGEENETRRYIQAG